MAQIQLYKNTNCGGKEVVLDSDCYHLKNFYFNDKLSSLIVVDGEWELYQDAEFKGNSYKVSRELSPNKDGIYNSYKDWGGKNDSISSVKLL